eukprot:TRINITY_DN12683_c0_g1_i1.p1 TRINITY_DN12683_c0_g1~~TRINITY_DN12683_c0_g1_i1.p1  ORF type:complete len:188 (-),score=31.02 TRINITY_DN12683_c0_g1_i1:333-896(-)
MALFYLGMLLAVHLAMEQRIAGRSLTGPCGMSCTRYNFLAVVVGLVCVCSMFLTGTLWLGLCGFAHGAAASCLFISANLYSLLLLLGVLLPLHRTSAWEGSDLFWLRHQACWTIAGWLSVVLYILVFGLWDSVEGCVGKSWCTMRNWQSVIEYLLAVALIGFTLGLGPFVREVRLGMWIQPRSESCE